MLDIKRIFDFFLAIFLLILLFIPFCCLAILVKMKIGSSIFFVQERPGYLGKPFLLFKFRSMADLYDESGGLLPDSQRLTSFGLFLRSSSLDELPEILNVLKGEMSFVGPRPLLIQYLPLYNRREFRRHEALPGITGWAQVNGRNSITWGEKFELDVWYVDNRSMLLDIYILFITFFRVLRRKDINEGKGITMSPFVGSRDIKGDDT